MTTISELLKKPVHALALLVTVSMVLLAGAQVLFRYVFKVSVPWTEEVVRVFFIWMIFIGTIQVESEGSQVRTMMFIERFAAPIRLVWETIISLTSIAFQIILFIGSVQSYSSERHLSLGSVPWMDYRFLFLPVIIASPLCVFFMLKNLFGLKAKLYPKMEA